MLDDLRYALRQLRLPPTFSLIAVGTLAIAVGANTAFFSLFHALVLRPLPLEQPDRLAAVLTADDRGQETGLPAPVAEMLARESGLFDGVAGYLGGWVATIESDSLAPVAGSIDFAGGDYYRALRLAPHLGRLLDPSDEERLDHPAPPAVLGFRFWQQRFGSDPSVIGRQVEIDDAPFTIVGVTPASYSGLRLEISTDVTVPLSSLPRVLRGAPAGRALTVQCGIARLRDDVTPGQAAERLQALWPAILEELRAIDPAGAERSARNRPRIDPLATGFSFMRDRYTGPLGILIALTGWMLLIACVNLAGLLVARATARDREIVTRLALGASRLRLVRQALAEGVVLALLGASFGLPLAWWGARALSQTFAADYLLPLSMDVTPDVRVLAVMLVVTLGTAAVFTVVPALHIARRRGADALGSSRTVARGSTHWGERLLVVQFALALVLLVGAGALAHSLARIRGADPGFRVDGLFASPLLAVPDRVREAASPIYLRNLLTAAQAMPGIDAAALTDTRPAGGYVRTMDVALAGTATSSTSVRANLDMVSPGFFGAIGVPILEGRELTWFDDLSRPPVAIVSSGLARQLFPNGSALGQRIRAGSDPARQNLEIVGIAADASIRDVRQRDPLNLFVALTQEPRMTSTPEMLLHATSPPSQQEVQRVVEAFGYHRARRLRSVDEQLNRLLLRERMMSAFATFFALMAAGLIAIGLYGLLAFAVRVRTREIGVRLAVGATPAAVRGMILTRGVRLAALGLVAGLPLALSAGRMLQGYLFDVRASEPLLLAAAAAFVLVLTLAASYIPARLASRVDPSTALRAD